MAWSHAGRTRGAVAAARRLGRFAAQVPAAVLSGVVASQALGPGRRPRASATLQEEACRFATEVQDWFGFDSNERVIRFLNDAGVPLERVLQTCVRRCPACGVRKPFAEYGRVKGGMFFSLLWVTHGIDATCRGCKNARAAASKRMRQYPPGTEPRTVVPFPGPAPAGRWANDSARGPTEDAVQGPQKVACCPPDVLGQVLR
jgi:hypothetical protein